MSLLTPGTELVPAIDLGPPTSPDMARTVRNVLDLFHEADREIKKIEHINEELPIPSTNELRYAGHHIVIAWEQQIIGEHECAAAEIEKAAAHCKRAIYDAHEIGVQFYLSQIEQFKDDYRMVQVNKVIGNYADLRRQARDARDYLQEVAKNNQSHRDDYYQECRAYYKAVKDVAITLEEARDGMNVLVAEERTSARRWLIGIVVGSAIALSGLFLALLRYLK